ncbi:hypothetical protein [Sagittula sp. S175]|uniref:hypothetical protein n=1 Tax=Sagittula sp. S175 TaxID=3415129 RepID=UPI003C7E7EFB
MISNKTAEAIVEEMLHVTWQGMKTGDFDLFAPCFHVPQVIETFQGKRRLANLQDLRDVFESVRKFHASIGLVDLARHVVSAKMTTPEVIVATHETRLVCAGNVLKRAPHPVMSEYRHIGGAWRVTHSQYAVESDGLHGRDTRPLGPRAD